MIKDEIISVLKAIELLKIVPDASLNYLIDNSDIVSLKAGECIFEPGSKADNLYIVLQGSLRIYFEENGQREEYGDLTKGDITGILPYSRMKVAGGFAEAKEEVKILRFNKSHFPEMIRNHYELTEALVHQMTNRIRNYTTLENQNEKLLSLGKLSAGLAHELNNPAAAIVRSSTALRNHLRLVPDKFKRVMQIRVTDSEVDIVNAILFRRICNLADLKLSLMERTALEDELTSWMDDHQFENSIEHAENLAEWGFTVSDLEEVMAVVPEVSLEAVVSWITSNLVTEKMVQEIGDASKRISDLVSSIKNYTHMDRSSDRQRTDVHAGLRTTLTMMGHKIRANKVKIVEEFESDLPLIMAYPGEVNQVFTNIIDNALDAMEDKGGILKLSTHRDGDFVKIDIADSGPGIPKDIIQNIFDTFFTTKEIGKGTGLGLDVVMKIMKQRHRGDVRVKSEPGNTVFTLCFPINQN